MITAKMLPSIEQRMSTWLRIQDQLVKEKPAEQKPAVTISREYGCEGYPLAETLRKLLEKKTGDIWTVFDKTLIDRVSQDTGVSKLLLNTMGDATKPLDEVLGTLMPHWKTHSETYHLLARQLVALASQGNVIIVGRGGAVLARNCSKCFHFRLVASLDHRIQSIQQRLNISLEEARANVTENQKARDKFIESLLNCSIADPYYYHAVFDASKSKLPSIARSMLDLMFES
jgi:hypothetical protein